MPLGLLRADERAEVIDVKSGSHAAGVAAKSCRDRVEDMGLRAGKIVEVLSNEGRGPILLKVDESRIAMGRGMAMKIMVRRAEKMNLAMLKPGEKGKIIRMGAIGPLKRRLMDMGVLVGEEVKVEKIAPLGDPIEVTIKNYNLSLRKKEAEGIAVEVVK